MCFYRNQSDVSKCVTVIVLKLKNLSTNLLLRVIKTIANSTFEKLSRIFEFFVATLHLNVCFSEKKC